MSVIAKNDLVSIRVLIVEDDLVIAEDMRDMIGNLGYEAVDICTNYEDAIKALDRHDSDVVLTDIALSNPRQAKDGVALGKLLSEHYRLPFIYVTSHSDEHTVGRAKLTRPSGYLVKPFQERDIYAAIEVATMNRQVVEPHEAPEPEDGLMVKDAIFVKDGHLLVKIKLVDLLWIKTEGNYLELHTVKKRHVVRSSMREFMDKLPSGAFLRVHKSYAVNMECVDAINSIEVMIGDKSIPVGRNYRDEIVAQIKTT